MRTRRNATTRGIQGAVALLVAGFVLVLAAPHASACRCGPYAPPLTSTGVGTATQTAAIEVPVDGSAELLDNVGNPVTTWSDPAGAGTYAFDEATSTISFTPAPGFLGSPQPANVVGYRITDRWDFTDESTYTPTVTLPAPPAAPAQTSTGNQGANQTVALTVPVGGTASLLDGSGNPVTTLAVAGQGVYSIDPTSGVVTFSPLAGFAGDATPVAYRVTDAYEQQTDGTVTVHVLAAALEAVPAAPTTTTTTTTTITSTTAPNRVASGTLPTTGASTLPLLLGGALLLGVGAGLATLARRRLAE